MAEVKKPFSLELDDEMRKLIEDGGECVAVEFHETETSASGEVVAVGTRQECEDALPFGIVIVPNGVEAKAQVWNASVLGITS